VHLHHCRLRLDYWVDIFILHLSFDIHLKFVLWPLSFQFILFTYLDSFKVIIQATLFRDGSWLILFVPFCGCIEINFNQNRFTKKLFFRFFISIYPNVFQKTKNLKACIAYADRFQNMKKSKFAFHIMSWYIGYSCAIWPGLTWELSKNILYANYQSI